MHKWTLHPHIPPTLLSRHRHTTFIDTDTNEKKGKKLRQISKMKTKQLYKQQQKMLKTKNFILKGNKH